MLIDVSRTTVFRYFYFGRRDQGLSGQKVALGVNESLCFRETKALEVGQRRLRRFCDSSTCGMGELAITCSPYKRGRNCGRVRRARGS